MHKYSRGHRTQILAQLAAVFVVAALFASVVLYVVTNPGSSSVVLALVISALVLFSLAHCIFEWGVRRMNTCAITRYTTLSPTFRTGLCS